MPEGDCGDTAEDFPVNDISNKKLRTVGFFPALDRTLPTISAFFVRSCYSISAREVSSSSRIRELRAKNACKCDFPAVSLPNFPLVPRALRKGSFTGISFRRIWDFHLRRFVSLISSRKGGLISEFLLRLASNFRI